MGVFMKEKQIYETAFIRNESSEWEWEWGKVFGACIGSLRFMTTNQGEDCQFPARSNWVYCIGCECLSV